MGQVLSLYLYLSQNTFYVATIILQFEEPLFILITFMKPHCIFVLKKLHFAVFMGESLSPPPPPPPVDVNEHKSQRERNKRNHNISLSTMQKIRIYFICYTFSEVIYQNPEY